MIYEGYKIIECKKFKDRLLGLMFKKNISYGLLFNNCNSVHTFFMKEKIDIIFFDKNNTIIKRYNNIKPWKMLICKNAKYVIEIPSKK